jgi:rhodanese-related sulfurtransferase/predicted small lipoprotein YifL
MKKRIILMMLLVLLTMTLVFTGCGKKAEEPAAPAAQAAPAQPAAAPQPAEPAKPAIDEEAVLLAAAKDYFAQVATSNNLISAKDLSMMLEDNPGATMVVDIRSAEDFAAGHIEGAYHSAMAALGDVMEKIPTNRQVVVTCYSGQTAGQAIAALRLAGFSNVKSLTSGMNGWKAAELTADETGDRPLADRSNASSPKTDEDKVRWEAAKAYFKSVAADGTKLIAPQDLYDALQTNPKAFIVVDIRSKDDFDAGHIEFSTHSAWAQFGDMIESLPENGRIVIACYSGQTAGQTVGVLRTLGFDAYSLRGGMNNGWKPAELPLVQ